MAETSDSVAGCNPQTSSSDPFPGVGAQDSGADFWYGIYAKNQDGSSTRDYEWGYVFEKSGEMGKKKRKKDVGSSSAACSASDLSEALSAVSAALSLSSSSHSSDQRDRKQREVEFEGFSRHPGISGDDCSPWLPHIVGNPGEERADNSTKNNSSFGIQSLSSESDGDDLVSSDRYSGDRLAKSNFNVNEEIQKGEFQVPELGMVFSSEEAAYKFYKTYANRTGFRVRKGKVQRLSDGTIRKRYFFCTRQGFRSEKQSNKITKYKRKETRTGCDAKIQFTVENGLWVVSLFSHEHNHQLGSLGHKIGPCTNTCNDAVMFHSNNEADMALERMEDVTDMGIPGPLCRKDIEVHHECEHSFCNQSPKKVRKDELGEKLGTSSLLVEETDECMGLSSPNGMETEIASFDEECGLTRKRTSLSKERSAFFIEECFNELHSQLNHKQKLAAANNEADTAFEKLDDVTDTEIPGSLGRKDIEVHDEREYGVCSQSSKKLRKDEMEIKVGTSSLSVEEAHEGAEPSLPNRMEIERASDAEESSLTRRRRRHSKERSAFESLKERNRLICMQKLALAKQLNLPPSQPEVWFQNRRTKKKLRQTEEVDCEFLKRCCETLIEENRRLRKELQRVLKASQHSTCSSSMTH